MKKILPVILMILISLNAQALFEVKDASNNSVFEITNDGIRIFDFPDTLMIISSAEIRANLDNSKGLSRSFSVSVNATGKAGLTNVMEVTAGKATMHSLEVTGDNATMSSTAKGPHFSYFSPENLFLGLNAGTATVPSGSSGIDNVFVGNYAGVTNNSGKQNIFIGKNAGRTNYSGSGSTIVGYHAGYSNTGNINVFIGNGAGYKNGSTGFNTYLGNSAGYYQTSGSENVYLGNASAMYKTLGNQNTMLGTGSGMSNQSGVGNVFLGYYAGANETGSNKLYIANSDTAIPIIHGDFATNNIGLGKQASSSYRLDVLHGTYAGNFYASTSTEAHTRGLYARSYGGSDTNYGIYASATGTGATNYAGYFVGNINVTGTVVKSVSKTKIDHPLDPKNKFLIHSSVESDKMMNIYNGNAILDNDGKAIVTLPEWFEVFNTDVKYQLTAIGAPGPNLYISKEIKNMSFEIAGGIPNMKVSWLITGSRNDNYAKDNPIEIEEDKDPTEKGYYLHPESYGHPQEMGIEFQQEKIISEQTKN